MCFEGKKKKNRESSFRPLKILQLIPLLTKPEGPGYLFRYWRNSLFGFVGFFFLKGHPYKSFFKLTFVDVRVF